MRGTYMIHAKLLHQLEAFLYGLGIGRSSKCTERMVVGISFQQYFPAVELHAVFRRELYGANTELIGCLISHCAVFTQQLCFDRI